MPIRKDWLDQVHEDALEPALPIIDPHHHLWDKPGACYMLPDILEDIGSGHKVLATVFVQAASMHRADGPEHLRPVGETEFVNGIAAQSASGTYGPSRVCHGIVGFADLRLGDAVDEVLEAHLSRAPDRFRGIRHATSWDASDEVLKSILWSAGWDASKGLPPARVRPAPGLMAEPEFRRGFARLAEYGLSYDAWLYHHQIPELTDLARTNDDVTIVLDHFGGPLGIGPYAGHRQEIMDKWRTDIADLAACPNVVAKLGGLAMPINGFGWHEHEKPPSSADLAAATRDYYLHTIDVFGPERCMFESNFPVDKVSCSYAVLWNSFKRIAADFSDEEKGLMFSGTANRVYRLNLL